MRRTIAITTQKGGVAKTTTAANLAAAWGERGKRILAVDLDPQFGLTMALGLDPDEVPATAAELLRGQASLGEATSKTELPGVELVCGDREMRMVEQQIAAMELGRERVLEQALEAGSYDIVLLDCPPSMNLLTINAMMAADELIIPVSMQDRGAFQGAMEVVRILPDLIRVGGRAQLSALVKVKANPQRIMYASVRDALATHAETLPVAEAEIPERADFNTAMGYSMPLVAWKPKSEGAAAYRALAEELKDGPLVAAARSAA
jgi:chromosome partitioning protein